MSEKYKVFLLGLLKEMTLACYSRPYTVLSSDGCAVEKMIKLAQRCNWKDPLTICRYVEGGTERTRSEPTCVLAHILMYTERTLTDELWSNGFSANATTMSTKTGSLRFS